MNGGVKNRSILLIVLGLVMFFIWKVDGAIRLIDVPGTAFKIAQGFKMIEVAPPEICENIQAIAFDTHGRLFVSTGNDIRILTDSNRDGLFDGFTIFSDISASGGILFDHTGLFVFSQNSLYRLVDANGDGLIDSQPINLIELGGDEPLFQTIKRGPDGWWYLAAGYGININNLQIAGFPLIYRKDGGVILRFTPDFSGAQIFAHGFFIPSGFDFSKDGELFVCDNAGSDSQLLPFKHQTRLLKVKNGSHCGWLEQVNNEPIARPDYYFDTESPIENLGVSIPSRLVIYKHRQFPDYFHNGIFLPLWSSGKILFFPELKKEGSIGSSELFFEAIGNNDFAPIDITVAPDGSLFVATGGAKTKSAIYKIQFIAPQKTPVEVAESVSPVLKVLNYPQPFEAWSRMNWVPLAEKIGFNTFGMVIGSEIYSPEQRARAVEVKMELFDGLTFREARAATRAISPIVRRKIAWALQLSAVSEMQEIVGQIALDPVPIVRESALYAASAHLRDFKNIPLLPIITPNIEHADRQVRIAAAKLASPLDDYEWKKYIAIATNGTPISQLSGAISMAMRKRGFNPDLINLSLNIVSKVPDKQMQLDALRLIIIGMGDYPPLEPSSPITAAIEPNVDRVELASISNRVFTVLNPLFPNTDLPINFEIARIFAMLQVEDRRLGSIFTSLIDRKSLISSDFYFLSALSILPPPRTAYTPPQTAKALFTMLEKFNQLPELTVQKSGDYINYLVSGLLKNDPYLNGNIVKDPAFIKTGLNHLIPLLDIPKQQQTLRLFFESINRRQKIKLSPQLINWLGSFTNDYVWMFLHTQWTSSIFQDEILLSLANNPKPADREIFLQGLGSRRSDVVMACLDSLLKIPPDTTSAAQFQIIKLLRRLVREPEQKPLREKALQLLSYMTNTPILIQESSVEHEYLLRIYDPIFIRFANLYPQVAMRLDGEANAESFRILNLSRVRNFPIGNPERGSQIFTKRRCINCHNAVSEFAPPLNNFEQKIPVQFLVQEIIYPDQRLSKDYQIQILTLKNKQKITGIPRFIGEDYLFVQTTPTNTVRIPSIAVEYMQKNNQTIMPQGLLNGITLQELADLCSFIRQAR